jgi:hypothetical protein
MLSENLKHNDCQDLVRNVPTILTVTEVVANGETWSAGECLDDIRTHNTLALNDGISIAILWSAMRVYLIQAFHQAKGTDVVHHPLSNSSAAAHSPPTRTFYHVVFLMFFHTQSPGSFRP